MKTQCLVSHGAATSALLTGLLLAGCPAEDDQQATATNMPSDDGDDETSGTDGKVDETDTADPSVGETTTPSGPSDTDPTTDPSATDTMDPTTETEGDFIVPPDGGTTNECDIWGQDCPNGEKCMPWDNMGGSSWNATKCSPVDADPNQPGDPCTVEGSGVSGIDDCALGSMCWNVEPETNMGVCVAFCMGNENNPVCSDPNTGCSITNEGVLILCLPDCDPLLQDCADGEACYHEPNGFFCSPDASGEGGSFGDPCEFLNVCDPGLWCADASTVPGCAGASCCSEYCDITDPMATCLGDGQMCIPYYDKGAAPPGYEDVGVCVIPQ